MHKLCPVIALRCYGYCYGYGSSMHSIHHTAAEKKFYGGSVCFHDQINGL